MKDSLHNKIAGSKWWERLGIVLLLMALAFVMNDNLWCWAFPKSLDCKCKYEIKP